MDDRLLRFAERGDRPAHRQRDGRDAPNRMAEICACNLIAGVTGQLLPAWVNPEVGGKAAGVTGNMWGKNMAQIIEWQPKDLARILKVVPQLVPFFRQSRCGSTSTRRRTCSTLSFSVSHRQ